MRDPLLLTALAAAPGLAICIYIYWKDKYEKEPRALLVKSFVVGMFSTLPAVALSLFAESLGLNSTSNDLLHSLISCILGIGLTEEFSKFFFVRTIGYSNKSFNEPFDGITYSVMVAMGFATLENFMYVFDEKSGGLATALMRMLTAVPAHATFGIIIGYYLGIQKCMNKPFAGMQGLLLAATLHGFYDFFLFNSHIGGMILGALVSLIIGIRFSLKAIRMHQQASPFA